MSILLLIITLHVHALTWFRVGVIEWIENTKPLKDFLMDSLTQDERKQFGDAAKYHHEWMTKYGGDNMRRYKTMYK